MLCSQLSLQGRYKLIQGQHESPWFDNIIVNTGLDLLGQLNDVPACLAECHLGTSGNPPKPSQTALGNPVASSTNITSSENPNHYSSPYWIAIQNEYSFPVGSISTTIREVGISDTAGTLFSRAVMPSPVDVLADESLKVIYELRVYLPELDVPWSDTINGNASTGIIRPARIDEAVFNGNQFIRGNGGILALDGALGDITDTPTGNHATGNYLLQPYVNGTYYRDIKLEFGEHDGNLSNGISIIYTNTTINDSLFPCLQISIDPSAMKTSKDVFYWTLRYSWG